MNCLRTVSLPERRHCKFGPYNSYSKTFHHSKTYLDTTSLEVWQKQQLPFVPSVFGSVTLARSLIFVLLEFAVLVIDIADRAPIKSFAKSQRLQKLYFDPHYLNR